MNLASTISLLAGGPGSGCHGENCGRKARKSLFDKPKSGAASWEDVAWVTNEGKLVPFKNGGHGRTARATGLIPKNTEHLMEQTVAMERKGHIRVFGEGAPHFESENFDSGTRRALYEAIRDNPTGKVSFEFHKPRQIEQRFGSTEDALDWLERMGI